ncbi:coiled coil [Cryptosporidium sp. chipmunk genotype I]|uniref:coiled coil n=1 Tax=Cryptosporidium sp. chipmunk genotype I TaxID=1280935 RepID=UPI00351A242E|nr:coiled coil [Cryptosporidium sp. chipmunk genotype I]
MALQDTASTAGILAELNNRLTSYESTIRELKSKNRDFVNRLRDSQQIRKDLCIKVNSLQNDLEKRDKELKTQKEQNKQLKKRVTNLNELNSNYQNKIEQLKSVCEKLRSNVKNNELNSSEDLTSFNTENTNKSCINSIHENRLLKNNNDNSSIHCKNTENCGKSVTSNSTELSETKNSSIQSALQSNQNKSLLVKKGDLKFSVEEINDLNMKYIPVPDDPIDRAIATFTNSRENKILFTRVKQGTYVYGRLMVEAKLVTKPGVDKNKPLLRIMSRGKLYTLADFVNTHENEELNNIEDSIRNQNSNLVSDGQALVVASPLNKFRTTQVLTPSSPIKITATPSVQQNPATSVPSTTAIQHFIQSPLSYTSNRIPIIDPKHNQGVNLQSYMVNYPNNTHEMLTQNTNSIVTPTYYNNINGMRQLSPINHKNSSFMQLQSMVPQQQFPYYHHLTESSSLNNQFNQNLSYHSKSNTSVLAPPPVAEYMPVTTPIIMARQPINTLNCSNNNSCIQQIPTQNISQTVTKSNELKPLSVSNKLECYIQQEERELKDLNNSLSLHSTSKINQQHLQLSESTNKQNTNPTHNQKKNETNSTKEIDNDSGLEDDLIFDKRNLLTQKIAVKQSSSPIKSVSASTIGEWYRQASMMKRCNSYSCENFSVTSNKNA